MALSKDSVKKLKKEFDSYENFKDLFLDVLKVNDFNFKKIISLVLYAFISILLSFYMIKYISFKESFATLTDLNITLSVSLLGLLIGGFSIVLSSLNSDAIYYLILIINKSKKHKSSYKITLLFCVEPLLWFTILLILTFGLKIIYPIYISMPIILSITTIFYLKILILFLLLFLSFICLNSLVFFIINMYNIIAANANFSILSRYATQNNSSIEEIIEKLEDKFNNSINHTKD